MSAHCDFMCKVIIVGDSTVGKSSLIFRFSEDRFSELLAVTIGVDFRIKTMEIDEYVVKAEIWDTGGQERFNSIVRSYYTKANAVIIVYDVNRAETFYNLKKWLTDTRANASADVAILIVGNKYDSDQHVMAISEQTAREFAVANNCSLMFTSAKTSMNVEKAFQEIVGQYVAGQPKRTPMAQRKAPAAPLTSHSQPIVLEQPKEPKPDPKCSC